MPENLNLILRKDMNRKYLEYQLMPTDTIDTFSEGMIKNNEIKGLAPLSFRQIDSQRFFSFDISEYISLPEYFHHPISREQMIHLFLSIIDVYDVVSEYMIEEQYIVLDIHYIYIDSITQNIRMICLPIENYDTQKDIMYFIKELILSVQYQDNDTTYVTEILNFIHSHQEVSLDELKNFFLHLQQKRFSQENIVVKPQMEVVQNIKKSDPILMQPEKITQQSTIHEVKSQVSIPKNQFQEKKITQHKEKALKNNLKIESQKTKRRDRIPTLSRRNINEDQIKVENDKVEKPLINIPKKLKDGQTKIPKVSKRITSEEAKKSLTGGLQRDVKSTYQQDITTVDAPETTILGTNAETTVLGSATTVLNSHVTFYPKITRVLTKQSYIMKQDCLKIGRDVHTNDFAIADNNAISHQHVEIVCRDGRYFIMDLKSTNYTYVDGVKIRHGEYVEIFDGSRFKLANEDFIFELQMIS